MADEPITALLPKSGGHQFVLYGDSCSGIPNALHERTFAEVNAIVKRLTPQPEFILFPGDEIIGLTPDPASLREQWKHWFEVEMAWLDRHKTPMFHTTGNHTAYDEMSEGIFREVLQLPDNGPVGQKGLSYWVRRDDLVMVFVHTLWTGLGGEGHVETEWLRATLEQHADAKYKIVLGHHPVFPVNGFSGTYQREIGHEYAEEFWGYWRMRMSLPMSAATSSHMTSRCIAECCRFAPPELARRTGCPKALNIFTVFRPRSMKLD